MESTYGSLAWRNLISSSVLEGFRGQGEITEGNYRGNHRGEITGGVHLDPFCSPFLPTIVRRPAVSGRDLMTSPYHSKITIILFPECCIGPCNHNLLITFSY